MEIFGDPKWWCTPGVFPAACLASRGTRAKRAAWGRNWSSDFQTEAGRSSKNKLPALGRCRNIGFPVVIHIDSLMILPSISRYIGIPSDLDL